MFEARRELQRLAFLLAFRPIISTYCVDFFPRGCCYHLVRVGDKGWVTTGPMYELNLFHQTFIFSYVCFCVFVSLGFIYGAHFSVYTIWPI